MKLLKFVLAVLALAATVVGCTSAEVTNDIHFLEQKPSDAPDMAALLDGQLVLSEKCLVIQHGSGQVGDAKSAHTAIWSSGSSLAVQGDSVQILNGAREIVAQVGNAIRVGGGEILQLSPEEFEANFSGDPAGCAAPYWVISSIEAP